VATSIGTVGATGKRQASQSNQRPSIVGTY
jgi:hypothetical protein